MARTTTSLDIDLDVEGDPDYTATLVVCLRDTNIDITEGLTQEQLEILAQDLEEATI